MICDDLKPLKRYQGLNKNLDTAIDYLQTHDLAALPDGRTEVDGDNVFINMMDATLHSDHGFHPEYHKTYADLQIDITGGDMMITIIVLVWAGATPTFPAKRSASLPATAVFRTAPAS